MKNMWRKNDGDGCGEGREHRSVGPKSGIEGEGNAGREDAKLSCVEATCQIHRPHVGGLHRSGK